MAGSSGGYRSRTPRPSAAPAAALLAALLLLAACADPLRKQVPLSVVMTGGELYFVLGGEGRIEDVKVETADRFVSPAVTMWHGGCAEPDLKRCPKADLLKYGQGGAYAAWGPAKALQKNCEYSVRVNLDGGTFASGTFTVLDDDTASAPMSRGFEQIYRSTITIERNGAPALIPYSITVSSRARTALIKSGPALRTPAAPPHE